MYNKDHACKHTYSHKLPVFFWRHRLYHFIVTIFIFGRYMVAMHFVLLATQLRDNDWPTSLGSCNGKAYDTSLVLEWMGDFLNAIDSLVNILACWGAYWQFWWSRNLVSPDIRTVVEMTWFKDWKLQCALQTFFFALWGSVGCGFMNLTSQRFSMPERPCASLGPRFFHHLVGYFPSFMWT